MSRYDWLSQLPGDLGVRMARCLGVAVEGADVAEGKGESPALERLEERRLLAFSMQSVSSQAYENGGGAVYLLQRDDATLGPATASLAIAGIDVDPNDNIDAADSSDWEIVPTWDGQSGINAEGLVVMPEGVGELTLTVNAVNDSTVEATEAFRVNLNEVGGTETYQTADGQILSDDDPNDNPYKLWIESSGGASEGGNMTFSVHRYNAYGNYTSSYSVLVRLKTAGSGPVSADAEDYQIGLSSDPYGSNYDPSPGSEHGYYWLDFGSNQDVVTFSVQAVDDARIEAGTETFKVVLMGGWPVSGQWGADVMDPSQAYGDIWENDQPSTFSVTASDNQGAEEGSDGLTFVISRPGELSYNEADVYLDLSGEAGEGAESDYTCDATGTGTRRSVHFSSGQTSATFCLTPVDDEEVEEAESVIVTLAADPDASWRGFATYEVAGAPGNAASGEIADNELQLELEGPVITEGLTEEFTLWVRDPFGAPIGGKRVTVDVDQQNGDKIESSTVEVVTTAEGSATGSATFSITGKLTGTAKIGLQPEGKARQEKNVVVAAPQIQAPNAKVVNGGTITYKATIFKAAAPVRLQGAAVTVTLANNNFVSLESFTGQTNNDGEVIILLKGLAIPGQGQFVPNLVLSVNGAPNGVKTIPIVVEAPSVVLVTQTLTPGQGRQLKLKATNSDQTPVQGLQLTVQSSNTTVFSPTNNPDTIVTVSNGEAVWTGETALGNPCEISWSAGGTTGAVELRVEE